MKYIIYVHGAGSSPISFNHIHQNLPEHKYTNFVYDSDEDIENHVSRLSDIINNLDGEINIIAHSLGGVIALGASYNFLPDNVRSLKIVTISSPFAGSKTATYLKWLFPNYGLLDNVSIYNPLILEIQQRGAAQPTFNMITYGGSSPVVKDNNDGVVSVRSQESLTNCVSKRYQLNHFEVLLSGEIVEDIRRFIWDNNENKTNN